MAEHTANRPGPLRLAARILRALTGPWTWKNLAAWIVLILVVLTIRWLLFEPYRVPSGSMEPTLQGNMRFFHDDRVIVNKLVYGPRIPFTKRRIFRLVQPKRWEIVVFRNVVENTEHKNLIKRVVGLPGERIHIEDGRLHVNGAPVDPPKELRDALHYTTALGQNEDNVRRYALYMAKKNFRSPLLNPENHTVQRLYADLEHVRDRLGDADPDQLAPEHLRQLLEDFHPVSMKIIRELLAMEQAAQYPLRYGIEEDDAYSVVPEDRYLVCGDNGPDSVDGRYFGWLPNGHILGRASCIGWPVTRWRDLTGFSRTWWGKGLLYGTPAVLAGYVLLALVRRRTKRRHSQP